MASNKTTYGAVPAEPLEATLMVEVTAPATLKEGYKFKAIFEGTTFLAEVPAGGVTEGQTLTVPFNPTSTVNGSWKDDIFACTRYGLCHPSIVNACCCQLVLLGQVMTRLKLDWLARPAPEGQWSNTFKIMVYITVVYAILSIVLSPVSPDTEPNTLYNITNFFLGIFMLIVVMRVRGIVRARNNIPETRCIGYEDCCCSFWCSCCTVSQLARQTCDYDVKDARFFTNDGIEPMSPVVIV